MTVSEERGNKVTIQIEKEFWNALYKLDPPIMRQTLVCLEKLMKDPNAPGLNYEKLVDCPIKKLSSIRVEDGYRALVFRQPESGIYALLYVGNHQDAYRWANSRKIDVDPETNTIQMISVPTQVEEVPKEETLFSGVSDRNLLRLGLPREQLPLVRSITDAGMLQNMEEDFSAEIYEYLTYIAEGIPPMEVLFLAGESQEEKSAGDITQFSETTRSVAIIDSEAELRHMLEAPLEEWRVFLHPSQRRYATRDYAGPALVVGGAGTGKTVTALHRAKYLASGMKDSERMLITTYTTNLARDLETNLGKILYQPEQLRRIDVINIDAWASRFLKERVPSLQVLYGQDLAPLWKEAAAMSGLEGEFSPEFCQEEWEQIVAERGIRTLEDYVQAARTGRKTFLSSGKRTRLWRVFEIYQDLMRKRNVRDIKTVMNESCALLAECPERRYRHVIVDESQDFSACALRLLRVLAGEEHPNDLFIVGDAHQRIYGGKVSLSACGINVKGRSGTLRVNYRTTAETQKFAFSLLEGESFDNLNDGVDTGRICRSLTHGEVPEVRSFSGREEECGWLLEEIRRLQERGAALKDICVTARTKDLLKEYIKFFADSGYRVYEIKNDKSDERELDGLRVATMHRVKGLDFQYMFVAAANQGVLPLNSAVNRSWDREAAVKMEKCLLYVALTRAQKAAYVSGYGPLSPFLRMSR